MKNSLQVAEEFQKTNRGAAEVILTDAGRYGGEDSLMVRWARSVLERANQEAATRAELSVSRRRFEGNTEGLNGMTTQRTMVPGGAR